MRVLLCALGLGALVTTVAASPPPAVLRWEQSVVIAPQPVDGLRPRELSALAWDEAAGELVAASDRGLLFRFTAHDSDGQLVATPRSAHRIEQGRNAEALHVRAGAAGGREQLWMLTETAGIALRLGARGEVLESRPWPVDRAEGGKRAGAEALAWQAGLGLLVALQQAQRGRGMPGLHVVHGEGGRWWAFEPTARGSHVKAIEALDGERLLVLERVTLGSGADGSRRFRTVLRLLSLHGCGQAQVCDAAVLPVQPPLPDGPDNFEGLACARDGRCWIVSDSGPDDTTPTRLLQLRLERP